MPVKKGIRVGFGFFEIIIPILTPSTGDHHQTHFTRYHSFCFFQGIHTLNTPRPIPVIATPFAPY